MLTSSQMTVRLLALASLLLVGCSGNVSDGDDLVHVSCFNEPRAGRCSQRQPAFYYDYPTDTCRPVLGGVCDRRWPFPSMRSCVEACGGRALR